MRSVLALALAACGPSAAATHCKAALAPGQLVITEVFADAVGGDAGQQWFEIYNATDQPLDLAGLELVSSRPDGSSVHVHHVAGLTVAPRRYATLGDVPPDQLAPWTDYGYGDDLGDLFNTGGGALALRCDATVIDAAGYGDVRAGHARELGEGTLDAVGNDDASRWCDATATEFAPGEYGTPGEPADCTPPGQCTDAGVVRAAVLPDPGQLVITEVMASPARAPDAVGEWIELVALADVDLNGLAIDRASDTAPPEPIDPPQCLHVAAGSYAILARSADAAVNGELPPPIATFDLALPTAGDVRLLAGSTVIDAITWPHASSGAALQLDPSATDAQSNDDPANFCDATTPYGLGDLGTPAAPNLACAAAPPPGTCDDGGAPRAIVKPAPGQLAISEIMPNPVVEPAEEWFEITNTGTAAFDLNELGLDRAGDTRAPDIIHAADCKSVPPGGFALFARSADPSDNGGLPQVDATFGFAMVNRGGDVRVLDGDTVLDAVTWSTSSDGASQQLVPIACAGATPYGDGSNRGTPRAANACM